MRQKGQFNIEYMVSLIVFVAIIIFLSIQMAQAVPEFHTTSTSNNLEAQAFRITDQLLNTPGSPEEWEDSSASSFGFATEPYTISKAKLAAFNNTCLSNYEEAHDTLGLEPQQDFHMSVTIRGDSAVNCGKTRIPSQAIVRRVRRTAFTPDNEIVRLTFNVWR